jgi:hypothetical protein
MVRQVVFLLTALVAWMMDPTRGEAFFVGKPAPEITGGPWINTQQPLVLADLRGQVVLVEFWTYG